MKCAKKIFNCPPYKAAILLEDKIHEALIDMNDKNIQ